MVERVNGSFDRDNGRPEQSELVPETGQRELIIGPTGSGKTLFAGWLLRRLPVSPIVIYDTKDEPSFAHLRRAKVVDDWDEVHECLEDEEVDYIVFRPQGVDAEELDGYLLDHFNELEGVPAYIDELADFHSQTGFAYEGLTHLLRKGRARAQTTIMSTQRPSHISRLCYTESQKFCVFRLVHEDDQKHVAKFIPGYRGLPQPPQYGFYFRQISDGDAPPRLVEAVELDHPIDRAPAPGAVSDEEVERFTWL